MGNRYRRSVTLGGAVAPATAAAAVVVALAGCSVSPPAALEVALGEGRQTKFEGLPDDGMVDDRGGVVIEFHPDSSAPFGGGFQVSVRSGDNPYAVDSGDIRVVTSSGSCVAWAQEPGNTKRNAQGPAKEIVVSPKLSDSEGKGHVVLEVKGQVFVKDATSGGQMVKNATLTYQLEVAAQKGEPGELSTCIPVSGTVFDVKELQLPDKSAWSAPNKTLGSSDAPSVPGMESSMAL